MYSNMKFVMHFSKLFPIIAFVLSAAFIQGCFSEFQKSQKDRNSLSISNSNRFGTSTAAFRVHGNVYPDGYFSMTLYIGDPPKPYDLDIDTGSELAWVHCDAPCINCPKSPHKPYKPRNNAITCKEPLCAILPQPPNYPCRNPADQCDYEIEYADHGSSIGVLVKDKIPIRFLNGSVDSPALVFGCSYDQDISSSSNPPFLDGVLGLADGKTNILSQFHNLGIMRNVFGHCFSSQGGGYLFLGDELVPSMAVWVPMSTNHIGKYYSLGPVELLFGGKNVVKGGFSLVIDSGSTYTYLSHEVYEAVLSTIQKNLNSKQLKDAPEDKSLPVCWEGARPFKSMSEIKKLFKPFTLSFPNIKKAVMEMPPETYLIITRDGNVCLGILDGTEAGLEDLNVLGDISLLDKWLIYDNEKRQIGWTNANCDNFPNVDRDNVSYFSQSEDEYDEL